jgi:hypothetical protein
MPLGATDYVEPQYWRLFYWRASQDLNLDAGSCNPVRILSATGP